MFIAFLGAWGDGITPTSAASGGVGAGDVEIEEAEDVRNDPSIGPATPMTPSAPKPKGLKA